MKAKYLSFALLIGLMSCTSGGNAPVSYKWEANEQPLTNPEVTAQVDALYDKMSEAERVAQLHGMFVADLFDSQGRLDTLKCRTLIPNGVGHFSQYGCSQVASPDSLRNQVAAVQAWIMQHTPNGIPALFHEEVISGMAVSEATIYPQQIGLACSFNTELAEKKTQWTAKGMRQIGGFLALSPMVDVVRNPYFNRLEESYGEDAYLSAVMGTAFVKGLQNGGLERGIAACSKHFLGYGGGAESDEKELMEEILMPHEAIIRIAGSKVVMTGYHSYHGIKAVANADLQTNILRTYLGYDGIMVSDYTSINQIDTETDPLHKAAAAINAGNDVEFPRGVNYLLLPEAIKKGMVSEATFEKAVKRVLTLKARLGLLDEQPVLCDAEPIVFDTPEERQLSYQLATQSVVMLKNNGILPLSAPAKIALTGPNANTAWAMLGDYTYQGISLFWHRRNPDLHQPEIVTLKQGLEAKLPEGTSLTYTRGCDWTEKAETTLEAGGDERAALLRSVLNRRIETGEEINPAKAIAQASASDVIIAAVGENDLLCGENRDRGSLRLPGKQEEFVRQLIATGKPVVLIVFGGRAQVISELTKGCAAVIQAWYPGEEGGNALADILYGLVSPSGKLCVSYPSVELNEPICYNYSTAQDERVEFPFGFGLSYNTYEYANLVVDKSASTSDKAIRVKFDVSNHGRYASDEIVQLYVSPTSDKQPLKPIQLKGFGRVHLEPGQTTTVDFLLSPELFAYYNQGRWTITGGEYQIKVGASSADIRLTDTITLTGDDRTFPLRTVYFSEMQE